MMHTIRFADAVRVYTTDRTMFPDVPEWINIYRYAVVTDDNGSWILTTAPSADALDIASLPDADCCDYRDSRYGEFWSSIAAGLDVLGDCNNPAAATAAIYRHATRAGASAGAA